MFVSFSLAKENSPHHTEVVQHLIPLAFAIYPRDKIVLPYQGNSFLKANAFKRLLRIICYGLEDYRLKCQLPILQRFKVSETP